MIKKIELLYKDRAMDVLESTEHAKWRTKTIVDGMTVFELRTDEGQVRQKMLVNNEEIIVINIYYY